MKIFFGLFFLLLVSCAPFQESPFSDQLFRSERELNLQSISGLGLPDSDGVIKMAIISDSHQNYNSLASLINYINRQADIDFTAHIGDFTDSAYNYEYNQFLAAIVGLRRPAFVAIGNHDAIGAGPELYRKAFGPLNFWFETSDFRFVFFNSNNWETPDQFNPSWLQSVVQESSKNIVIFTHVPLLDTERFNSAELEIFKNVVSNSRVKIVFNGHNHVFALETHSSGTIFIQCPRTEGNKGIVAKLTSTAIEFTKIETGESQSLTLKP